MTREAAIKEINRVFEPAFANYIIIALTEGATPSDKALKQQPCEDCISRQDALNCVTFNEFRYRIVEDIKALPPVTPKEKKGRWISFGVQGEVDGQIVQTFSCSECGAISIFRLASGNIVNGDLCPNCGCRMFEPQESEG